MFAYVFLNFVLLFITLFARPYSKPVFINANQDSISSDKINNGMYCLVAGIILALFMGLRGNFATDYDNYVSLFDYISDETFSEVFYDTSPSFSRIEIGFRLICKIVSLVYDNSIFFMTVISVLFIYFVLSEAKEETSDLFLFIILFVNTGIYYLTFNMMRQGIAAALVFWGTRFIRKHNFTMYILVVLCASYIHSTSILIVFLFWILLMKISLRNICIILLLFSLINFFLNDIVFFIQRYRYTDYTYGMQAATNLNGVIVQWSIFAFSLYIIYIYKIDYNELSTRIILNGSILYILFTIIALRIFQVSRMTYFFNPFLCALGANAISTYTTNNKSSVLKCIIFVMLNIYLLVWFYGDEYYGLFYFFWDNKI